MKRRCTANLSQPFLRMQVAEFTARSQEMHCKRSERRRKQWAAGVSSLHME